jgi:4-oxalocrotonate tautomerase
MPDVVIMFREGRSVEQKRALAKNVTAAIVESFECEPARVSIQMIEQKAEHIARGGKLVLDILKDQAK